MNEDNKVVTNNPVPEAIPQMDMKKPHDNKMMLLTISTLIFGLIMTVSLIVALGSKNTEPIKPVEKQEITEVIEEKPQEVVTKKDDELGTKKLISEIENLNFDEVLDELSDQEFEAGMY